MAAQGFGAPRPEPFTASTRDLRRVVDRVGVIQIDSVNVVTRSHYLPFFSRVGPYDTTLLDRLRDRAPRHLVEYWAHEASLIPPSTWPLLDHRMRRADEDAWGGMKAVAREHPELVAAVLAEVEQRGPLTSRQLEAALEHDVPRSRDQWGWNWSLVKAALEHLFWSGQISSAGRTPQFERRYAALSRVVPASPAGVRAQWLDRSLRPDKADACVELVRIAARAHGIGSAVCLSDYFRLRRHEADPAIERLVASGELEPVEVAGWKRTAYLWVGERPARVPRALHTEALVSPFDSLVWQRDRTHALYGFHYRIEIYTPAHRRVYGYYVLPFVFGDTLVARCDVKADRAAGVLRVPLVSWEDDAPAQARPALVRELEALAAWLGLSRLDLPAGRGLSATPTR